MAAPTGKGVTPMRSIRIADGPWESAKAVAAANGETLTDVIVRALVQYVKDDKRAVQCACGRKFTNRAGFANHARRCPQEQARVAEVVRRIEQGA